MQKKEENLMNRQILVVSFGTSDPKDIERDIWGIEESVREAFPDWQVRGAFTSGFIVKKLKKVHDLEVEFIDTALEKAVNSGVEKLVVLPTHLMPGIEYEKLKTKVKQCEGKIQEVILCEPLLGLKGADKEVAKAALSEALKAFDYLDAVEAKAFDTAIFLVGHGTKDPGGKVYEELQKYYEEEGIDNLFVATVEGEPASTSFSRAAAFAKSRGYKNAVLCPFMITAGSHAVKDMGGEEEDSLKSILIREGGLEMVTPRFRGLGSFDSINEIFVRRVKKALEPKNYRFFAHENCEFFPCHKGINPEDFNCLFCYCPLYALGDKCGGAFTSTDKGVKSCENCNFPHKRENYDRINRRFGAISMLAGQKKVLEHTIRSGDKELRCGITTGTVSALSAKGAAIKLLTGEEPEELSLVTPVGFLAEAVPEKYGIQGEYAFCEVRKDAGDDPDDTDGILIRALVKKTDSGITIRGGKGVGYVTKPGLDQKVGSPAINRVPREMITAEAAKVLEESEYRGGLEVLLEVPMGEEIAKKTFNPMLGIQGGISILGTSGMVEPMSQEALVRTIEVLLRQAREEGDKVILVPGNYGTDFLRREGLTELGVPQVKFSNFIGETLDLAGMLGFKEVLIAGHIGKLVKVAAGIMNTHSAMADGRKEIIAAHAAVLGGDTELCRLIMESKTTGESLLILEKAKLTEPVMKRIMEEIQKVGTKKTKGKIATGVVAFSKEPEKVYWTRNARELINLWKKI